MWRSPSTGHDYAQTLAFVSLVVSQWANAFNARSDQDSVFVRLKVMNRSFYFGMILSVALQMLALFGPLGEVLHIRPVEPIHLALISITAFVIPIGTCELHKLLSRRQARR